MHLLVCSFTEKNVWLIKVKVMKTRWWQGQEKKKKKTIRKQIYKFYSQSSEKEKGNAKEIN